MTVPLPSRSQPSATPANPAPSLPHTGHITAGLDLDAILTAVEETAYLWNISSDRIEWAHNAAAVLHLDAVAPIATGASFQFQIAPEHVGIRARAIAAAEGQYVPGGVPYRLQYRFLPGGRRSDAFLWVEDHGRCWTDASGRPSHACGVLRIIDDRWKQEQRLIYRSDHDDLTGQLNRTRLTEALATVIDRTVNTGQPAAFMIAAVKDLEHINESFGFDVGDEVVAAAGRLIKERLRGGDTIGRYSSNKFGLILNDCGPGAMRVAAERFIAGVRETTIRTSDCPISATLSIGGVMLPDHAANVPQAIGHALEALERARHRTAGTFCGFEPSPVVERSRLRNITIAEEVVAALEGNRMRLALQPIVRSGDRTPAFYECLMRMVRPDGTIVGAANFIEIAEQVGLSRLIDRRATDLALDLLIEQRDITLSLNVSANTTCDHDWLLALRDRIGARSDLASRLIVEITETAMIKDVEQTVAFVDALKEMGCRIAIDDFGAGYTSFRNLKHLAADIIKIDGAFVRDLAAQPGDTIFLKTLADLAKACSMETVAEWVGDEATAAIVEDLGIDYMQGFLFGRPLGDPPAAPEEQST